MSKGDGLRRFAKLVAEDRVAGRSEDEVFEEICKDPALWRQITDDLVSILAKEVEAYAEEMGLSEKTAQDLAGKLLERCIAGMGFNRS
jgi:hypothetical protein